MPNNNKSDIAWSDVTDSYWVGGVDTGAKTGAEAQESTVDDTPPAPVASPPKTKPTKTKVATREQAIEAYGAVEGAKKYAEYWGDAPPPADEKTEEKIAVYIGDTSSGDPITREMMVEDIYAMQPAELSARYGTKAASSLVRGDEGEISYPSVPEDSAYVMDVGAASEESEIHIPTFTRTPSMASGTRPVTAEDRAEISDAFSLFHRVQEMKEDVRGALIDEPLSKSQAVSITHPFERWLPESRYWSPRITIEPAPKPAREFLAAPVELAFFPAEVVAAGVGLIELERRGQRPSKAQVVDEARQWMRGMSEEWERDSATMLGGLAGSLFFSAGAFGIAGAVKRGGVKSLRKPWADPTTISLGVRPPRPSFYGVPRAVKKRKQVTKQVVRPPQKLETIDIGKIMAKKQKSSRLHSSRLHRARMGQSRRPSFYGVPRVKQRMSRGVSPLSITLGSAIVPARVSERKQRKKAIPDIMLKNKLDTKLSSKQRKVLVPRIDTQRDIQQMPKQMPMQMPMQRTKQRTKQMPKQRTKQRIILDTQKIEAQWEITPRKTARPRAYPTRQIKRGKKKGDEDFLGLHHRVIIDPTMSAKVMLDLHKRKKLI